MPRFELKVAWRHLKTGGTQTWLIVGAVALGAFLVIFMSSLIYGLQRRLINNVIGSIPNITITAPDYKAEPPWRVGGVPAGQGAVVTREQGITQRKTNVEQWQRLSTTIETLPEVRAVAPVAQGGGIISRGAKDESALIIGVIPERQTKVIRLEPDIISGDFYALDSDGVFIGTEMSKELNAVPGDKVRLTASRGNTRVFTVRGIFDLGIQTANNSWVYMQLKPAQSLLRIGTDVTAVYVKINELFDADNVASDIRKLTPLKVESWMEQNASFLQVLQTQNTTSVTIQVIAVLAAAFGVSSVLIVFVVQKSRDIGILKSMGATSKQIQRIFTLEGLAVGAGGALIGAVFGSAVCLTIESIIIPGRTFAGEPANIVPMQWRPLYVVIAFTVSVVVGFLSSIFPARRAARLNPVEVIKGG